jgi:hypothetical protein
MYELVEKPTLNRRTVALLCGILTLFFSGYKSYEAMIS